VFPDGEFSCRNPVISVVIRLSQDEPTASESCLPINIHRRRQLEDIIKAKISRSREVNMFGKLSHANYVLLDNAKRQNDGYLYEIMSCLVFSAFKHEAFINHLGYALLPDWHELERGRHSCKQTAILTELHLSIDKGQRPFQTLHGLFNARDELAHGKPQTLNPDSVIELSSREMMRRRKPLMKWESLCTLDFAQRAYDDTEEIAEMLWTAAGFDISELRARGHAYAISEIPNP